MEQNITYTETSSYSLSKVFAWLAGGLLFTLAIAFGMAYLILPLLSVEVYLGILVASTIALVIEVIVIQLVLFRGRHSLAIPYFLYAGTMGIFLSSVVICFEVTTILYAFLITAGIFGIMAVYGAVTKNNLFSMGVFIGAVALGVLVLSLINLFFFNEMIYWITSFAVFGLMILMVAFDVWRIKRILASVDSPNLSIYCAFQLYVDFIYLFIRILSIVARSKK